MSSEEHNWKCRWFGHKYRPDLLHCYRCKSCRGSVCIGRSTIFCTRVVVDGKITDEHRGYVV